MLGVLLPDLLSLARQQPDRADRSSRNTSSSEARAFSPPAVIESKHASHLRAGGPRLPISPSAAGLFVALFGLLIISEIRSFIWPIPISPIGRVGHLGVWLVLLVIVKRAPVSHVSWPLDCKMARILLWGLALTLICASWEAGSPRSATNSSSSRCSRRLPLWLVSLIVACAGVVEELFYRGYAVSGCRPDRIESLSEPIPWRSSLPPTGRVDGPSSSSPCAAPSSGLLPLAARPCG